MTPDSYGSRLQQAVARCGRLCVGIDPHPAILDAWRLPPTADGLERCARTMIEAAADRAAVVKPQSAFFEAYGAAGIAVLERVLADARAGGLLTLLDVKRGDIGSTMAAYTQAYLTDGAPLAADAVTLSPFLGPASLDTAVAQARATGRGVYLLAATSNPEAAAVQQAITPDGATISQTVVNAAAAHNAASGDAAVTGGWGSVGLVIGATIDDRTAAGVDPTGFGGSILAPGFGAQGGTAADLHRLFGAGYDRVLPASSRGIMAAGPGLDDLRSALSDAQDRLG